MLAAWLTLSGCAGLPQLGLFTEEPLRTDRLLLPGDDTHVVGEVP